MVQWLDQLQSIRWNDIGLWLLVSAGRILLVLVFARLVYGIVLYLMRRVIFYPRGGRLVNKRKAETLYPLLKNILFYILTFFVVMDILKKTFQVDTGALLASAGMLGIAIGLGAQALVKDMIGGFFILFDDQLAVGESVKIGEFTGTVEEIDLRTTRVRNVNGQLHIVPNGGISSLTNYSRGQLKIYVDIFLPYDEDVQRVKDVIQRVCETVGTAYAEQCLALPALQGIIEFGERNVTWRIAAAAQPQAKSAVEFALREGIYQEFVRRGM
jgi:small conductance mechanosensitive channel